MGVWPIPDNQNTSKELRTNSCGTSGWRGSAWNLKRLCVPPRTDECSSDDLCELMGSRRARCIGDYPVSMESREALSSSWKDRLLARSGISTSGSQRKSVYGGGEWLHCGGVFQMPEGGHVPAPVVNTAAAMPGAASARQPSRASQDFGCEAMSGRKAATRLIWQSTPSNEVWQA